VRKAEFFVNATARKCNQGQCTQVGDALKNHGAANLTVVPNIIFQAVGAGLTHADAAALVEWAEGERITDDLSFLDYAPDLEYPKLVALVKDYQSAKEKANAYGDLQVVAMLLARLHLKAEGLIDQQQLGDIVPHLSLGTGDSFLPAMVDAAKTYGKWLEALGPSLLGGGAAAQEMQFQIDELSYCNLRSAGICSNAQAGTLPGPYLVFVLTSSKTLSGLQRHESSNEVIFPDKAVPYLADVWMRAQF
jgi:hypothetical protein